MAVNILTLVQKHLKPALLVDAAQGGDLQADLSDFVDAQLALHGWVLASMSEQDKVYAAALTLESLMPRLAQIFTDEVQERRAGHENVKLPDRARFFSELRKTIATMKATAESGLGVDTTATGSEKLDRWPGVGIAKWV